MLSPWRLRLLTHLESLGTVRAVADALGMSPSSVSQQLSVLERESRAVLLEHQGRRVALTPAGVRLAEHAREILQRIEAAEADLAERRTDPVGVVRVAAFSSGLHAVVLPVAAQLRAAHPRLLVSTVELEPHDGLQALRRGEVDLALVYDFGDGGLPVDDRVRRVRIHRDPVVLVLPRDHHLLVEGDGPLDIAALSGERWAMDQPGCYLCDVVTRACRHAGFEPEVVGRYSSYLLLLEHVQAGLAVAALPALAVDDRFDVAVRALEPALTRTTVAALPAGSAPVAAVQLVLEQLRARGAALVADRAGRGQRR
jgi:DNA-binding transcriptional LysR family regulator